MLTEPHSCAASRRPFASACASKTPSTHSAPGHPASASVPLFLRRVKWKRRKVGKGQIIGLFFFSYIPAMASSPRVLAVYKKPILLKEALPEEGKNRGAVLSSRLQGRKGK